MPIIYFLFAFATTSSSLHTAPGICDRTCCSISSVASEGLPVMHYFYLLQQLESQFQDYYMGEDQEAAADAIRRTMAALASKEVFADWTAYQALRAHRAGTTSGALATLAQWQIFRERLKSKDESLLSMKRAEVQRTRGGLVAIDAPAKFHELETIVYVENEMEARAQEVGLYVESLGAQVAVFVLIEEPPFDMADPAVGRFFDPEFILLVNRYLKLQQWAMPESQENE